MLFLMGFDNGVIPVAVRGVRLFASSPRSQARGEMFLPSLPSRFPQPRLHHNHLQGMEKTVAVMGGRGFMQVA